MEYADLTCTFSPDMISNCGLNFSIYDNMEINFNREVSKRLIIRFMNITEEDEYEI